MVRFVVSLIFAASLMGCAAEREWMGRDVVGDRSIEDVEAPFDADLDDGFPTITPIKAREMMGMDPTMRIKNNYLVPLDDGTLEWHKLLVLGWQYQVDKSGFVAPIIARYERGHAKAYNFVLVFDLTEGNTIRGLFTDLQDLPYGMFEVNLEKAMHTAIELAQTYLIYRISQSAEDISKSVDDIAGSADRAADSVQRIEGQLSDPLDRINDLSTALEDADSPSDLLGNLEEILGSRRGRQIFDALMN